MDTKHAHTHTHSHTITCAASVKHHLSSEVTLVPQCVRVFFYSPPFMPILHWNTPFQAFLVLSSTNLDWVEIYENVFKLSQEEEAGGHALSARNSVWKWEIGYTHPPHSAALEACIDHISTPCTAFAGRASDQLKELLGDFQVIPLKEKSTTTALFLSNRLVTFFCVWLFL